MTRRPWHNLLTIKIWSPYLGRVVLVSPLQYRLLVTLASSPGGATTQRSLARRAGYSLTGVNHSLRTLAKLGVLGRLTRLGCKGWTRARLQVGVFNASFANVSERSTETLRGVSTLVENPRTTVRNIQAAIAARAPGEVVGPTSGVRGMSSLLDVLRAVS